MKEEEETPFNPASFASIEESRLRLTHQLLEEAYARMRSNIADKNWPEAGKNYRDFKNYAKKIQIHYAAVQSHAQKEAARMLETTPPKEVAQAIHTIICQKIYKINIDSLRFKGKKEIAFASKIATKAADIAYQTAKDLLNTGHGTSEARIRSIRKTIISNVEDQIRQSLMETNINLNLAEVIKANVKQGLEEPLGIGGMIQQYLTNPKTRQLDIALEPVNQMIMRLYKHMHAAENLSAHVEKFITDQGIRKELENMEMQSPQLINYSILSQAAKNIHTEPKVFFDLMKSLGEQYQKGDRQTKESIRTLFNCTNEPERKPGSDYTILQSLIANCNPKKEDQVNHIRATIRMMHNIGADFSVEGGVGVIKRTALELARDKEIPSDVIKLLEKNAVIPALPKLRMDLTKHFIPRAPTATPGPKDDYHLKPPDRRGSTRA